MLLNRPMMYNRPLFNLITILLLGFSIWQCSESGTVDAGEDNANRAPEAPSSPSPEDDEDELTLTPTLSWEGSDLDPFDKVIYTLFLDTVSPPESILESGLSSNRLEVDSLLYSTEYFWQVRAKDKAGLETIGDIWSFVTVDPEPPPNTPPDVPRMPLPSNDSVDVDTALTLNWVGQDSDSMDVLTYSVVLDSKYPPVLVISDSLDTNTLGIDELEPGTRYFWQVTISDADTSIEGPLWSFTTRDPHPEVINTPPDKPTSLTPLNGSLNAEISLTLEWIGGDADSEDDVTYELYLDTANPPLQSIISSEENTQYDIENLEYSTVYYWQVIASDADTSISGDVFTFTTKDTLLPPEPIEAPVFNPDSGSYVTAQLVTITSATTGVIIRYTLDGSEPTQLSNSYTEPVAVTGTSTLKARAFSVKGDSSEATSGKYTINNLPQNEPPILIIPTAQSVNVQRELAFTLFSTDPDSHNITYAMVSGPPEATLFGSEFSWTPDTGQAGEYTLIFSATDDGTPALSDVESVIITVTDSLNEPEFTITAPDTLWDGEADIIFTSDVMNLTDLAANPAPYNSIHYSWSTSGVIVSKTGATTDAMTLTKAYGDGTLTVTLCLDVGGPETCKSELIEIVR